MMELIVISVHRTIPKGLIKRLDSLEIGGQADNLLN